MKRWILCICILALAASAADAAPSRASSRIRAYKGLMEVEVAGGAEHAVLDSLAGEPRATGPAEGASVPARGAPLPPGRPAPRRIA